MFFQPVNFFYELKIRTDMQINMTVTQNQRDQLNRYRNDTVWEELMKNCDERYCKYLKTNNSGTQSIFVKFLNTDFCVLQVVSIRLWFDDKMQYSGMSIIMFLSDEGPMLETLDFTIRIGSTPTFSYFHLYPFHI